MQCKKPTYEPKICCGLRNIYCSEILFDAGVNPEKICNELSKEQIEKIIYQPEEF